MKKTDKLQLIFLLLVLLLSTPYITNSQSIKRYCISSYGANNFNDSLLINSTAGQSFNTVNYFENNKTSIFFGYQQPNTFAIEEFNIETNKNELKINIFPNPAKYLVNITSKDEIINSRICVVDMNGKYILNEKIYSLFTYTINCETWNNGIYLITIYDEDEKISKTYRLIISK